VPVSNPGLVAAAQRYSVDPDFPNRDLGQPQRQLGGAHRQVQLDAVAPHAHDSHRLRVGSVFHQLNFGLLTIDWRPEPAVVDLQILDVRGAVVRSARLYAPADSSFRSSP
jgi:hypothetical protein